MVLLIGVRMTLQHVQRVKLRPYMPLIDSISILESVCTWRLLSSNSSLVIYTRADCALIDCLQSRTTISTSINTSFLLLREKKEEAITMASNTEHNVLAADKEQGVTSNQSNNFLSPDKQEGQRDVSENTSVAGLDEIDQEKQQAATPTEEAPPRDITGWKWIVVVLSILSSTFLFALDNTIVADVQPVIVREFNSVSKLSWLSVSFLIGAAATNLVWGKIFGQFNAKWTYILCVTLFEVGSAICGAAPTMDALIVGRAICGVGGSGMYVGVMTLLAATTTIHERPMYVGGTGLTWYVIKILFKITF
ncbi:hypothetical protein ONS96_003235 [Cadophora gregata f. sp. sojae]|nr:hypothetical protein ONS96_003235 [Cadophora gregata f. sp. sojae]